MSNNTILPPDSGAGRPGSYLALGDSYTIGQSVASAECYPVQVMGLLNTNARVMNDPEIIATTGWTTMDLWNAIKDKPLTAYYDIVSILIGVNDQYQGSSTDEYREQFAQLLARAVQLAAGRSDHVFVLSIPDYSVTPFAHGSDRTKIAAEIDSFNRINKLIADQYHVTYLNITEASRKAAVDPSLIASDRLHYSGKEYRVWANLLAPLIKQVLH